MFIVLFHYHTAIKYSYIWVIIMILLIGTILNTQLSSKSRSNTNFNLFNIYSFVYTNHIHFDNWLAKIREKREKWNKTIKYERTWYVQQHPSSFKQYFIQLFLVRDIFLECWMQRLVSYRQLTEVAIQKKIQFLSNLI